MIILRQEQSSAGCCRTGVGALQGVAATPPTRTSISRSRRDLEVDMRERLWRFDLRERRVLECHLLLHCCGLHRAFARVDGLIPFLMKVLKDSFRDLPPLGPPQLLGNAFRFGETATMEGLQISTSTAAEIHNYDQSNGDFELQAPSAAHQQNFAHLAAGSVEGPAGFQAPLDSEAARLHSPFLTSPKVASRSSRCVW